MSRRRILAATGLVLVVVAPVAHAGAGATLDGRHRTHVRYSGHLSMPAVKVSGDRVRTDILTPTLADCSVASCDITPLKLTLPRGTSTGRITVTVTVERDLYGYVVLYDGRGTSVHAIDLRSQLQSECCTGQAPDCCTGTGNTYVLDFTVSRLGAGRYTLVVYDRGGLGNFTTDVEFKANPPDRQTPK